ncbi:MAG: S9 family peptidase [Williamsia sp.]|nr:S9 family peptidase [Williamsia sp.]
MKKIFFAFLAISSSAFSQSKLGTLTVEKIMRDPKWIGTSPADPYWSLDGKYLFFSWNPEQAISDSVYYITADNLAPRKTSADMRQNTLTAANVSYNTSRSAYVYAKQGDLFLVDVKTNRQRRITQTTELESNPQFILHDRAIAYTRNQNLYAWEIESGLTMQLTNFQRSTTGVVETTTPAFQRRGGGGAAGPVREERGTGNQQERWLQNDQLKLFDVLRERKQKRDLASAANRSLPKPKELRTINLDDRPLQNLAVSPDGRFVTYRLYRAPVGAKNTIVPDYVTESGFTTDIPGRTKVGAPLGSYESFIYDREKDTVMAIKTDQLPGIRDLPDYVKDYPQRDSSRRNTPLRSVTINGPYWNEQGTHAVVEISAQDNKDRWIMLLDAAAATLQLLDRQRDEAWIGGPGVGGGGFGNAGRLRWIDEATYWYQSEASGYSHLYTVNVVTGKKAALTSGNYEVQRTILSPGKKYFYITTNEVHPGEQQFYRLPATGGKAERITTLTGANQVDISPDEKQLAILYSYSNKPWELYLQENKPGGKLQQITRKAQSEEFASYPWKDPQVLTFTARDGAKVYARLFKPTTPHPSKPAVIFVHGAGYLQNAHKWWSSYFHEYMFNNLLVDNGYTVMDIDYRGSAGYGRDWRTGIYRYMGGKDLTDHVDAVKYLVDSLGVDPKRVGLYGGSYGGFITLMAMFTQPDVFAAGAGLRCVTDWANYNHGYTANILNEPFTDSIAYKRSSPIYFANGLKGHLLMCHGMVDTNVNFQDIVKLSQRLIELGKNNWELAVYPMEDHGFVEPSSWTDEYNRIFNLFETYLK